MIPTSGPEVFNVAPEIVSFGEARDLTRLKSL